MKKNLFMVAAVALLATVSCNKEIIEDYPAQNAPASDVEFTAGISTRTALGTTADADGVRPVTWVKNDKITVNGVEFYTEEEGEVVRFKTESTFAEAGKYYAAYPSGVASGQNLSEVTISATQSGAFADASISVAVSNDKTLSFKNVGSMLKFQVPAEAKEVTIESTSNLAGKFPVNFDEAGEPVIGTVTGGSKTITLEGSFKTGTDYYVAVLPGSHTFTIRLDGYLSKASTTSVDLARAQLGGLKTLPAPELGSYKLMGLGDWTTGRTFYKDVDGYLLQNVTIKDTDEFKFVSGSTWGRMISLAKGKWAYTYDGDGNNKGIAGTFDIWASASNDAVCIIDAGSARPAFTSANKLLHLLLEGYDDNGLYMWVPSSNEYNDWDKAWKNYKGQINMKKSANDWQQYSYYTVPSNAVDKSCKFLFKWYGGQTADEIKTINNDMPFWRNNGGDGAYELSSRIGID